MRRVAIEDIRGFRTLADGLFFPESPRFSHGELFFVDGPHIRAADLNGHTRIVATTPADVCLGLEIAGDGTIYGGGFAAKKIFRIRDGEVSVEIDLDGKIPTPTNELVRLPGGEFLVGEMGFDLATGEAPKPAGLHLITSDGRVRRVGPDLLFPNGFILKDGGRTLYVVAGLGTEIHKLTLDASGDVLKDEVAEIVADPRPSADGIGMDRAGYVWYADMELGAALRLGQHGRPDICVDTAHGHAPSCWVFTHGDVEWLAIGVTDVLPFPGVDPHHGAGRVLAAPLAEILAA